MAPTTQQDCRPQLRHSRPSGSITGALIIDLSELTTWDPESDSVAVSRIASLTHLPAATSVVVRVGEYRPPYDVLRAGVATHLNIRVEGATVLAVREWIDVLRGERR